MKVPFPDVDSTLAVKSHMYVCIKNGIRKEFIKCQTFKPTHKIRNRPPYKFLIEKADINRNPFVSKTTIDCDKSFFLDGVIIDQSLVTDRRKDVCEDLFLSIKEKINHKSFKENYIEIKPLLSLNNKIKSRF